MGIDDLEIYNLSMKISERIWQIVITWNYFEKDTIGKQLARSADSISANIAEGYGRFSYKENKMFCYYSRGSLIETQTWVKKAVGRGLISQEDFQSINNDLNILHKKLNSYIKSIGAKPTND